MPETSEGYRVYRTNPDGQAEQIGQVPPGYEVAEASPITTKVFLIDAEDEWHEIGGYLDDVIARAALAEILGKVADTCPDPGRWVNLRQDIAWLTQGERHGVSYGDDQYIIDDRQARVDAGRMRKCPSCCEMTDDSKWADELCARCVGEELADDGVDLDAMRERLAALEALRPEVEQWAEARHRAANTDAVGDWESQGDLAEGLADSLCKLLGISR